VDEQTSIGPSAPQRHVEEHHKFKYTDVGNGELLASAAGETLRFVTSLGWHRYSAGRWVHDPKGERARQEAQKLARSLFHIAADLTEPEQRDRLIKHAKQTERSGGISNMLHEGSVRPQLYVGDVERLDALDDYLNLANGTLDLHTFELREHRPDDLLTRITKAKYDPAATCPFWEDTIAKAIPNKEVRDWVQCAMGYSLLGSYSEWLFMCYGTGSNGKSTILEGLRDVLGDYAAKASPELLGEKRERGPGPEAALASTRGARLVTTIETEQGKRMAEVIMKELTGDHQITARFMKQNPFTFTNRAAIWMATNHKPELQGTDYAVWRRVRLIPFTEVFPEDSRMDPKDVRACVHAERDGILNWLLNGLRGYRIAGTLDPAPAAVDEATKAYREEMDAVKQWLSDRCELVKDENVRTGVGELYRSYKSWCDDNGKGVKASPKLKTELEEQHGLRQIHSGGKFWIGVRTIEAGLLARQSQEN
jgi:putative DNA primase/helicase